MIPRDRNGWRSVEDSLPDVGDYVLAYRGRVKLMEIAQYFGDDKFIVKGHPTAVVTHWMSLPKPPTDSQQHDLSICPNCGGEADNGHDRCYPPNPYYCTKCDPQQRSE